MLNLSSNGLLTHFLLFRLNLASDSFGFSKTVSAGLITSLAIYSAGLAIALLFLLSYLYSGHDKKDKIPLSSLVIIFTMGLLVRLAISVVFTGHPIDISCFKAWASSASNSLSTFYTNGSFADYPPLYIYILFFVEKIRLLFFASSPDWVYTMLIKLPSIIADVVCSYILYKFTLEQQNGRMATLLSFFYLFNPVTILVSCIWGQVDGFFMLLLALATIRLYEKKYIESTVWYALTVLFKPQGLIFLPVLFFILLKEKNIKLLGKCFGTGLVTFIIPIIPFTGSQRVDWIFRLYFSTATNYKYASLNAYNFFALLGANWKDDTQKFFVFSYSTWGMLFIVFVTLITAWYIMTSKKPSVAAYASAILISGVYVLSSKMHERYIFPVLLLLLLACAISGNLKHQLYLYIGFTVTAFINILQVFTLSQKDVYWVPVNDPVLILISILNLAFTIAAFILAFRFTTETNNTCTVKFAKVQSTFKYHHKEKGVK